jgi:hypothetical protein
MKLINVFKHEHLRIIYYDFSYLDYYLIDYKYLSMFY